MLGACTAGTFVFFAVDDGEELEEKEEEEVEEEEEEAVK